jgi:hypothetical protein
MKSGKEQILLNSVGIHEICAKHYLVIANFFQITRIFKQITYARGH